MPQYSIIIPTLNEEENIHKLLTHLKSFDEDFEIIISDGGSTDKTIYIAERFDVKICTSSPGKGLQLNEGSKCANGKILIYLHADTFLPANAFNLIKDFFNNDDVKIATFGLNFDSDNLLMKAYAWFSKFDSIFTTFGDQVIIIKKDFLYTLGMFPNIKTLEDVELFRKARKKTKIFKLPANAVTSARRFNKNGIIKTQLLNGYFLLLYLLKVHPDKIYKKYFYDK